MRSASMKEIFKCSRRSAVHMCRKLFALIDHQFYENSSDIHSATTFILNRVQRNESVIIVAENEDQVIGLRGTWTKT